MKHKPSEWIVLADLMSGVVAVLVVMLVVVAAQHRPGAQRLPEAPAQADATPAPLAPPAPTAPTAPTAAATPASPPPPPPPAIAPRQDVSTVLGQVQTAFAQQGASSFVAVDAETGIVTLKERAFRRGSACIEPEAKAAFAQVEARIADYLRQNQDGRIYVEGHTDDKPVKAPVTDYRAYCTVYDDNFTLSAARAREARLLLIGRAGRDAARRVIVAGYGDSQPLPGMDPGDERNRRVELRFVSGERR